MVAFFDAGGANNFEMTMNVHGKFGFSGYFME